MDWRATIESTKATLIFSFSDNSLARRCVEILDRLTGNQEMAPTNEPPFDFIADFDQGKGLPAWLANTVEPFNPYGWSP